VNFENSAKPRVGDWVITVGNPFGLGGTATAGIISAYGRNLNDRSSTFVDYIQIDAPINRGNSGGPTFDIYGRVIGVNTAIFSPSGGSVGIGFAIPSDVADTITKQLISGGKVVRGYIGAEITTFGPEMAEAQGLGDQRGAIIQGVVPGGPSARGGLLPGDVVIAVGGHPVKSSSELTREVAKASAGSTLQLTVLRDGKRRTIAVKSGVRPSEKELASNIRGNDDANPGRGSAPAVKPATVLGMQLSPLDEAGRRQFSVAANIRGLLVQGVDAASDAAQRGLKRGDVIVSVGAPDRTPASAAEFSAAVEAAKKAGRQNIMVAIHRAGRTQFLPLKIGS
jgi:serine protease Do